MTQYADDTSLLLCKDSCLTRSLAIIGEFTRASGAVLNHANISEDGVGGRMCLGCSGALKILWVLFETSGSATLNWNRSIAVVQRKVGMWRARPLCFIGKVLVLKVDVLPSLLYMAHIYPLPASLRRPLVWLVFQFMWGGRLEYVARVRSVMVWTNTGPWPEQLPWHFGHAAKCLRGHPEFEVARVGLDYRHLYEVVRRGVCPGPVYPGWGFGQSA
ncbi:unnamed protein product, partial [Coregonus sp. 'balchen']